MIKHLVIEELEGDTLTPISIYRRMTGRKKFLFESSLKHAESGRYSFIGSSPSADLFGSEGNVRFQTEHEEHCFDEKPLDVLKRMFSEVNAVKECDFPFIGGAVGFVSYDVVRHYESIGEQLPDNLQLPDVHFMIFEELVVFDHLLQKVFIVGTPLLSGTTMNDIQNRILQIKAEILYGFDLEPEPVSISAYQAQMSREDFVEKVKKAKEYISEGEIFQVVLSQRMIAELDGDSFSYYRKLRIQNPSPYMYYLDFGDYVITGVSPESLIKVTDTKVITNPIAGTRRRGKTGAEDDELASELLHDEKELAEHRMLLDLGRNDLGRVCEFGTVQLVKNMKIEKYKHVMHIVSEISGTLAEEFEPIDALISCLPAGTVSGAPKIRAMEIINELEEIKRGVYSGAIGYLSANRNLDFALAIRTMIVKDKKAYIQAGAGIVHDSVPEKEFEETRIKLKAFLEGNI